MKRKPILGAVLAPSPLLAAALALAASGSASGQAVAEASAAADSDRFHAPVRLEADGRPIDIANLSDYAHAGPWIADVDGDGDRDLVVGDFPGYFWLFENTGTEAEPRYTGRGKLQAGGEDAKTPIY